VSMRLLTLSKRRHPVEGVSSYAQAAEMLFRELICERWTFDVELLRRARQHDLTIVEVPVIWVNDNRRKMRYSYMFPMLLDSIAIAR
jgi:hypothetical protein